MMALSLITLPTTGPAAPAAPPSVAPAPGAFDLLLPITDPANPRHEPAPNGKEIGKDMPVNTTTPNPLTVLTLAVTPSIDPVVAKPSAPQVSEPDPVMLDASILLPTVTISVPPTAPAVASPSPRASHNQRSTIAAIERPVSRPVSTAAGEHAAPVSPTPPTVPPVSQPPSIATGEPPAPVTSLAPDVFPTSPAPAGEQPTIIPAIERRIAPSASRPIPFVGEKDEVAAPVVSRQLPPTMVDSTIARPSPIAPSRAQPIPAVLPDRVPIAPLIGPAVSRLLPTLAGEVAGAPSSPATATPSIARQISVSLATPTAPTTPAAAVVSNPAVLPESSGATAARDAHDLPKPVSRLEASVAIEMRPATIVQPLTTPRIAPAAQVFADAIHRATRDDRAPAAPDAASLITADIKTHAVTATADAQHGALDLRQEQWPARMIERIDALRDAANANDASIRLIPDALGKIDVSLKRDGDTVAVHFTAQQAETRQLLADAAPKLAELAEARGLKLAQHGADTAGQQQQRQQPTAPAAAAPDNRDRRRAETDDTESTDTRIA